MTPVDIFSEIFNYLEYERSSFFFFDFFSIFQFDYYFLFIFFVCMVVHDFLFHNLIILEILYIILINFL